MFSNTFSISIKKIKKEKEKKKHFFNLLLKNKNTFSICFLTAKKKLHVNWLAILKVRVRVLIFR